MNSQSSSLPDSRPRSPEIAPAVISPARRWYWSVRRELYEHRVLYIAPLAVAALFLLGFLISLPTLPHHMRAALALGPTEQRHMIEQPYFVAEGLIMATGFVLVLYYCLDALYSERRDRSILFWKSLPVSDLTTVLSKATIPVLLILFSFVITVALQLIMLVISTPVLLGSGLGARPLWTELSLFERSRGLLSHLLTVHTLWYAPIYGWLLMVSAWARRAPFVWAVLPLVAIGFAEKIAFNTSNFAAWLVYRISGPAPDSAGMAMDPMTAHVNIWTAPGLWIGLAVAAVFLWAAVRLRRYRGPI
jgi:ABC-2 type transport system permease protein